VFGSSDIDSFDKGHASVAPTYFSFHHPVTIPPPYRGFWQQTLLGPASITALPLLLFKTAFDNNHSFCSSSVTTTAFLSSVAASAATICINIATSLEVTHICHDISSDSSEAFSKHEEKLVNNLA
jgi:hypothetical protein